MNSKRRLLKNFRKDTSGVALVEFAIFLQVFVLALAVVVEGSRIFFSYQGAVVGVRDAARFLARTAPGNICTEWANSGTVDFYDIAMYNALLAIIDEGLADETGDAPDLVVRGAVGASWICEGPPTTGPVTAYRQTLVPMAQVSATFTIQFPLGDIFDLNGFTIPPITHTVTDRSRIFGV